MSDLENLVVMPRHIQQCGFCLIPGARDWFKQHNLDWRSFVYNGIAASELLKIDDSLSKTVVEQAMKERANG